LKKLKKTQNRKPKIANPNRKPKSQTQIPPPISMSEQQQGRGGFNAGMERKRDGAAPRGGRGGRGRGGAAKDVWVPSTKLGRLVQAKKIKSIDDIFLFSLPIKEVQIIDAFFPQDKLKDAVMKISSVQKCSAAGQTTRFKAWVVVGDSNGHVGFGVRVSNEAAGAIRGAMNAAKLNIIPVRLGYWGSKVGAPHTVPCKVAGKCGSVRFRLVPAPRGTGLVASKVPKKVLTLAGIQDVYTSSFGSTRTVGNYVFAIKAALEQTYTYLTPDNWGKAAYAVSPYEQFSEFLSQKKQKA
jgi:small subunit ribosomal protein S2e